MGGFSAGRRSPDSSPRTTALVFGSILPSRASERHRARVQLSFRGGKEIPGLACIGRQAKVASLGGYACAAT